jgi:hypothetical protein
MYTSIAADPSSHRAISALEGADLLPALPERADADDRLARPPTNVLDVEELVLAPERQEVREERVEVRLGAQVQDLRVMRVIDVREHAQQLPIHVLDRRREVGLKLSACTFRSTGVHRSADGVEHEPAFVGKTLGSLSRFSTHVIT